MPKQALQVLTESMFYVLMAFSRGELCGIDAAAFIEQHTGGRVRVGPATLYTILEKFQQVHYLQEVKVEGRRRTYRITEKGLAAYRSELDRLRSCVADADRCDETEGH